MEELLTFDNTVEDEDGRSYVATVLGEPRDEERWIGRIRFTATTGATVLETGRETTQPNHKDLSYWATGLTYAYLEGALARARRQSEVGETPESDPGEGESDPGKGESDPEQGVADRGKGGPDRGATEAVAADGTNRHTAQIQVDSADPSIVEKVMGAREPTPGTLREVPNSGIIIYEGPGGEGGASHSFTVQFGSYNSGATLANWLWSRLHGLGVEVRVEGQVVELTNDALNRAITGPPV